MAHELKAWDSPIPVDTPKTKPMEHKFKEGDLVEITGSSAGNKGIGGIHQAKDPKRVGRGYSYGVDGWRVNERDLKLVEGPKFKVGDRVMVSDPDHGYYGRTGIVKDPSVNYTYVMLDGMDKRDCFENKSLELEPKTPQKPTAPGEASSISWNVGDKVKVIKDNRVTQEYVGKHGRVIGHDFEAPIVRFESGAEKPFLNIELESAEKTLPPDFKVIDPLSPSDVMRQYRQTGMMMDFSKVADMGSTEFAKKYIAGVDPYKDLDRAILTGMHGMEWPDPFKKVWDTKVHDKMLVGKMLGKKKKKERKPRKLL